MIFNTLSITVAQRTREFATLRTLGGSRKQVMRSVIAEGFVIGLLASVLGLLAGIGLAKGLVALFAAHGRRAAGRGDRHRAAHDRSSRSCVGTLVTRRGQHPAGAPGDPRAADRGGPRGRDAAAVAVRPARVQGRVSASSALAVAAIAAGVFGGLSTVAGAALLGGGVLLLFAGMAMLAPRLVVPLARFVGAPARGIGGVAGELAGANAVRNPGRTASTAAALMIGITLVTLVAVLGSSIGKATTSAIKDEVHAGYVIDAPEGLPFRADGGDELARRRGRHGRLARALGPARWWTARNASSPASTRRRSRASTDFKWPTGSLSKLGADGAIVTKKLRRRRTTWRSGKLARPDAALGREAHAAWCAASTIRSRS